MKRLHLALATNRLDETIKDYSERLAVAPELVVPGEYALWRTPCLNVSVRYDENVAAGTLRHLGWEDSTAEAVSESTDVNGILWEHFAAEHQAEEINALWPEAKYVPE